MIGIMLSLLMIIIQINQFLDILLTIKMQINNQQLKDISFQSEESIIYQTIKEFQLEKRQTIEATPKNQVKLKQQISKHYIQYCKYFQHLQNSADTHIQECLADISSLQQHKIIVLNQKGWNNKLISFTQPFIVIVGQQFNGTVIKYEIVIAKFKLQLKLLNLKEQAPKILQKIGEGGFGQIYRLNYGEAIRMISKRIIFKYHSQILDQQQFFWQTRPNKRQIQDVLCEYAIYKICSLLKIGPKIKSASGFQLVCYSDCIEFYMEQCAKINEVYKNVNYTNVSERVKFCVRVLHKLKIIHKDIKPDNILFSHRYNNFVMTDFGISHSLYEECGHLSYTYQDGTQFFMSPQMKSIPRNTRRKIDLYYNDLYALRLTISRFSIIKRPLKIKKINQVLLNEYYFAIKMFMLFSNYRCQEAIEKMLQLLPLVKDQQLIKNRLKDIGKQNINKSKQTIQKLIKNTIQQDQIKLKELKRLRLIFNEISYQKQEEKSLQFLIRVYGFDYILLEVIQKMKSTPKLNKLSEKIRNHRKYKHNYEDIQKLEIIGQSKNIQKILQIQIHKYQQKLINQQSRNDRKKLIQFTTYLIELKIKNRCKNYVQDCFRLLNQLQKYDKYKAYQNLIYIYHNVLSYLKDDAKQLHFHQNQLYQSLSNIQSQSIIIVIYNRIISIFFSLKLHNQILQLCKRLLKFKTVQINLIEMAKIFISMGNSYYYKSQLNKAYQFYERSLNLIPDKQNYKIYNFYLNNIGNCYFKKFEFQKARAFYQQDLKRQIQILGQCNPDVAMCLNNIGNTYLYQSNLMKALQFYQNSLQIKLVTLGEEHPDTAVTFINLGLCYMNMKNYSLAKAYFYKGLHIQIQTVGQRHLQTGQTFNNLGQLFEVEKQYEKAINFTLRALRIKQQTAGRMTAQCINCLRRIGNSKRKLSLYNQAIIYYSHCIQLIRLQIIKENCNIYQKKYYYQCFEFIIAKMTGLFLKCNRYWGLIYVLEKSSKYCPQLKQQCTCNQISFCYMKIIQIRMISNKRSIQKKCESYKFKQLKARLAKQSFSYISAMTNFYLQLKKQLQSLIWIEHIKQNLRIQQLNEEQNKRLDRLLKQTIRCNKKNYLIYRRYFKQNFYQRKIKRKNNILKHTKLIEQMRNLKQILFKAKTIKVPVNKKLISIQKAINYNSNILKNYFLYDL